MPFFIQQDIVEFKVPVADMVVMGIAHSAHNLMKDGPGFILLPPPRQRYTNHRPMGKCSCIVTFVLANGWLTLPYPHTS